MTALKAATDYGTIPSPQLSAIHYQLSSQFAIPPPSIIFTLFPFIIQTHDNKLANSFAGERIPFNSLGTFFVVL